MLRLKGHQNFRIEGAYRFAIAIGKIDPAGGQADVIQDAAQFRWWYQSPNHVLRLARNARSFFDARTCPGAQVKTQLAGVHRGKEVLPQMCDERQTCQAKDQKTAR